MDEKKSQETVRSDISERFAEAQVKFNVMAESVRYRVITQLLTTAGAMIVGITTTLVAGRNLFGQVSKFSDSLSIAAAITAGVILLIAITIYFIKRFADRRIHAERVRDAFEVAYFRALDRSSLNPRNSYPRHVERTY